VNKTIASTLALAAIAASTAPLFATTKGLNQIVTPDIQPQGVLSVSYQQQDPSIGNPSQIQLELGITKRFEVALFQGFKPADEVLNAEYGIIQGKQWLLSTGFSGYSTQYPHPAPYLVAGYQSGNAYLMAGVQQTQVVAGQLGGWYNQQQTQAIVGAAYHVSPRMLLQVDYQAGESNFATAGFTYSVTPQLSLNPALYYANSAPQNLYGYAVLTWNVQL